jgi:drug/metabolite transporter (DMT)-like permease
MSSRSGPPDAPADRPRVVAALGATWLIWGTTFLAIHFALEGFPPLIMAGARYLTAGVLLYAILRLRGEPAPTWRHWRSAAMVGTLLVVANACVAIAQQWVSSGVAAMAIASVPLWTALFAGVWERWPTKGEWLGLAVGLGGVMLLSSGGELRASTAGAGVLLISTVAWALGSMSSRRVQLPKGLMSSAAQMLAGGAILLAGALLVGERVPVMPSARAWIAFGYMVIFGSIVGFSAYTYLLSRVRPALATSYAYVNPVLAVILGAAVAGEAIAIRAVFALGMILGGVAIIAVRKR